MKISKRNYFGLKKNVIVLGLVSFLNDMSNEIIHPLLPIFLVNILGAPVAIIGLIEGIADSVSSLIKVASGWMSDKIRKRKIFVSLGYGIAVASRSLLAFSTNWIHVLGIRFGDRFGKGLRTPARDALVAETKKKLRGRAFGFHRAMDQGGAVVGPIITFLLLPFFAYREIFLLAIIPGIIGVILVLLFVKEKKIKKTRKVKISFKKFSRKLKIFIVISGLFTLGNFSFAFLILRAVDIGIPVQLSTLLYLIFTTASAVFAMPAGMLSDKIGRKWVIVLGYLTLGIASLGFALAYSIIHVILLFALAGVSVAVVETIPRTFISDLVQPKFRATAIGTFHTVNGLAALPASLVMGILWQLFSASTAFYYSASIALISTVLLILFVK